MRNIRSVVVFALLLLFSHVSHGQTALSKLLSVAAKVGTGYNVNQNSQDQLNAWLVNQAADAYLVTSYKNEITRFQSGAFQRGTLHVVLTAISDNSMSFDTITIDSQTAGSFPDNGVRTSTNTISFSTQDFSTYQKWLLAAGNPASGFGATKVVPYDFVTYKGILGTLTLGQNQTFGAGGTATSSYNTADIRSPLSYFLKLTWDSKVP